MRRSIPLLVAVGSCVSACQGALDLDRYSFGPVGAGAGGAAGSSGGGASGDGGSSNAGAGNGGTGGNSRGGAGGSGGVPPEPEQAVAVFDHYRFARGGVTYGVGAEAGLLLNDPGALSAVAGVVSTERGGTVNVAADGGFIYTPTLGAWGDDFFEYTLAESQSRARVRLTLTPGTVPLGDVAGNTDNGFVILGAGMNAGLGAVVAGGGDVNGDGRADLLVSGGGVAYVVFGKSDAAPIPTLDLAPMGSSPAGFAIVPSSAYPQAGYSLASAGDVNGDGLDDILVGTASFNINGSAYVVFGKTTTETVDLAALDAGAGGGFAIVGAATGDAVGLSVSGAGDVNGDGLADVVVGANGTADGTAYVVFGRATLEPFALGLLNSGLAGGFAITGPPDDPEVGIAGSAESVAGIGDVNGDGLSDVAFNARGAATSVAYVVFGKRDTALVSVTALGGVGFAIDNGAAVSDEGMIVSPAGDVNGDGFADIVLGDDDADPSNAGAAYVVFGKPDDLSVDFVGLKAGLGGGFVIPGGDDFDNAGGSVAGAGDFDADGFADLLVGADNAAPGGGASKGKAYLVWGTPGTTAVQLSDVDAEIGGVAIEGAIEQDFVGSGVANAGDVDGDGLLDLLVGASGADAVADSAGLAHVLFGWDAREALGARDRALVGTSGDDTLGFDGAPLISAAGGNGTDTLSFAGANLSLDLRDRALRVESIEIIDVRGSGDNTLFLDDAAVRRLPATRAGLPSGLAKTLVVLADAGDTLFFDSAGYAVIGSNAGRDVYQKTGAFYGIEVSPGVRLTPPSP